ncbi:MAG: hypothetical protein M5U01_28600 [Ardenticatenaceae bacterium]|nr:hypothetical protein [Ardenticatenaceae bacterium]HBY92819.1 hypothetical protein [Chloroflexota bacterium]
MTLLGFVVLLIVAAITGALGQALAGYSRGGCLASVVVGFVGAWIGLWIARQFDLPTFIVLTIDGRPFPLVWAIIGAAIFAAILGLLFKGRAYY